MNDAPESNTGSRIINERKPAQFVFDGKCSKIYWEEYEFLALSHTKRPAQLTKLYFYLRILARHYTRPPAMKTLKVYFPSIKYTEIEHIVNLPRHDYGEHWFIPKLALREFLQNGSDVDLLTLAIACKHTTKQGTFRFSARSKWLPEHSVNRAILKLKGLGFIEPVDRIWGEKFDPTQKYRWTILK